MIWSLQFSGRTLARVIRDEDGKPVTGYIDWLTAQALVTEHNRDIDRYSATIEADRGHKAVREMQGRLK